jgi:gliding motility-associated-like protein
MKSFLLTALICCCNILAFGQDTSFQGRQNFIQQIQLAAAQRPASGSAFTNNPGPAIKIPGNLLSQALQKQSIKTKPVKTKITTNKPQKTGASSRPNAPSCEDTSYRRLVGIYNGYLFVQSVTQTMDGGLFVSALMHDSTALPNPWWKTYGLLIKMDREGNITWIKEFADLTPGDFGWFFVMRAFELANRDIICIGFLNTTINVSDRYQTVIYRLTPDGEITWQNCLRSDIGIFNSPAGSFTFYVESAVDGLNGDVILSGTTNSNLSSGKIETVVRLNNLGKLVWDANYGNHGYDGSYLFGAEGVSAFMQNGQIILVGLSHGTNNPVMPPAINFLTLDYNNGNLLAKRFFRPSYPSVIEQSEKSFAYWSNYFKRLSNGHFLFYGKLFSDLITVSPTKHHFGVVEFDASFNPVDAYTISSGQKTNYSNNVIHFDASGSGLISTLEFLDYYDANLFFGAFRNKQFLNQRKAFYPNAGLPGNNGFAFLGDNGYAYVQSYFENLPVTKSYIEFRKMHNSDTSSQCLGKDTALFRFLPLNIIEDPDYWLLDPNEPNKMVELPLNIRQTDTISSSSLNPCRQTNYCDTIKIHGNPVICGNSASITFTAFRNKECGASVEWNIAKNAIDSFNVLSDSSVQVWFKNINWQGKLYALLPAGKCYPAAVDSVVVSVVRSQSQIDLGGDTILCGLDSMVLHAGNSFSRYQWQDGSTDSVLTVVAPGLYWVKASDFCGNNFTDSITINPSDVSISIGSDRNKCNNDTLHLEAPPGFISYSWGPAYNINTRAARQVIVQPATDTLYFVKAEKTPGCFAYDTIRVKVNLSTPVNLGADKIFCEGDSAVLDAGSNFTQYQWSNGSASSQVSVFTPGNYSVRATSANGCKSYDTIQINTRTNPLFTLNDNPRLCAGTTRTLHPGNYIAYLWQNGNTSASFVVSDTGSYYVTVWDSNLCKGSDTVQITSILPTPANFLPIDTAICNYGSLLLKSAGSYSQYTWSNNATSSSINITEPGIYWLQVTDTNHCTGKDFVTVSPKDCLTGFHIPTAFTPNNDGNNDNFKPFIGGVVKQYQFTIYNRWGQAVFTTKDLRKAWDGIFGGMAQDTNVFAWICSYQLEGEAMNTEKGTVIVIR